MRTKPPSGTRDFLPADVVRRRYVVDTIRRVYERYGFSPLETPAIESLSTLLGKYGQEGDQLLYRLLHRKDALSRALARDELSEADLADQGLRYDLTVPLARVVANYPELPRFFKRYQIQPVWRADRPSRGRFREFYQCDADIMGTSSPIADAEVFSALCCVLHELGFDKFSLKLNHRQLLRHVIQQAGIDPSLEQSALVAVDKLDKIGVEGVKAELVSRGIVETAVQSLLDLCRTDIAEGNSGCLAQLRRKLPSDHAQSVLDELEQLLTLLLETEAASHVQIAPDLARGLGYYTGSIIELAVADLSGSIGGGGRYDGLIGMFGKRPIPAVGASLGLERILLIMQERQMFPDLQLGGEVLLCWFGIDPSQAIGVARRLRDLGIRVETYPEGVKLGKQLQYADAAGVKAPFAAIVGETEVATGQVTIKHMETGQQRTVAIDEVPHSLKELASSRG